MSIISSLLNVYGKMLHHFRPLRPNEFITKKQIKALYPSLYLALSSAAGTLVELRNSSHIICHILSAKILNRGAKNMTLILLTRASETVKKHTVTQEATTLLPCFLSNPPHTHTHTHPASFSVKKPTEEGWGCNGYRESKGTSFQL